MVRVDFTNATPPEAPAHARSWSPQQEEIFRWFETGEVRASAAFAACGGSLTSRAVSGEQYVRSQHLEALARAGTGKTTTIVEGVSRAPERQILLAAFNKSIAKELQARIRNPRVECKTLHGLGFKYIRRNWQVDVDDDARAIGLAKRAAPDAPEQMQKLVAALHTKARELAPEALFTLGRSSEATPARRAAAVAEVEDVAARFDLMPDPEWEGEGWDARRVADAALTAMCLATERTAIIDFADMIFLPIVMGWVRPLFDMVVIDEAQDMTRPQLTIARGACRRGGRIAVVGDDRQAIYQFRGADEGSMETLRIELKAALLPLTVTYRCASSIVDLARQLVPDYQAAPGAARGEIVTRDVEDALAEMREGDFLISRTNAPLVGLCMALLKRGVRACVRGRDIGKGIISLLRRLKARTVADIPALLEQHTQRELEAAAKLSDKARETREEFIRDQQALVLALCEGAATVTEVEGRVTELFSDDVERGKVMCSSVHRAKGLETDRTFLLQGTFRSGRLEEENLRYVAITRAKQRLCWIVEGGK